MKEKLLITKLIAWKKFRAKASLLSIYKKKLYVNNR